MNREYVIYGSIAGLSLAVGATGGYLVAEKRLREHYEAVSKRDIEAAKQFYKKLHKDGEFETPVRAAEALHVKSEFASPVVEDDPVMSEAVEALQSYSPTGENEGVTELQVQNVFRNARPTNDVWDYEAEVASRTPDRPYIITHQEFLENDPDHEQSTLTYYEGDDTLADSMDQPVPNADPYIGNDSLAKFGHGSDDNNIVYVRNEKLELDFEVLRSKDKFAKIVLGFIEPEDDRRKRPQKLRRGDDG